MKTQISIITLILILLFGISTAEAAQTTFTVNTNLFDVGDDNPGDGICFIGLGNLCTLRAAIEEANASGGSHIIDFNLPADTTITIFNGIQTINTDIEIDGSGVGGVLTLEPTNGARAFDVNAAGGAVTISHLTIENGSVNGVGGGAIRLLAGTLNLDDVTLDDNHASTCGGAIFVQGGTLNVRNSELTNNQGVQAGGAICALGGDVAISGSTFAVNDTLGDGGAIYVFQNDLSVTDSTLIDNVAVQGGAIFLFASDADILNSTLESNLALTIGIGAGGAVYGTNNSTITITDSHLEKNFADFFGGGVFSENGIVMVTGTTFFDNRTDLLDGFGGGIGMSAGLLSIHDSHLLENASKHGGAIFADSAQLIMSTTELIDNFALIIGGGIAHLNGISAEISDTTFYNNSAAEGGGMHAFGGTYAMERVEWLNNTAFDGVGGGLSAIGTGLLRDQHISGNDAIYGGGMSVTGISIERALFVDNSADQSGGGLALHNGTVSNSTFANNSAEWGGAIAANGESTLNHTTIAFNTASNAGGGVYIVLNDTLQIQNSIVTDNANGDCALGMGTSLEAIDFNMDSDGSCPLFTHPNDNPLLGALTDNGGFTPTLMPNIGSPALDSASPAGCAAVGELDQRGFVRDDGACDLGAAEMDASPTAITLRTAATATSTISAIATFVLALLTLTGLQLKRE